MTRVFVSELFHEGHSFSTLKVGLESFSVSEGEALLTKARKSGSILGGAVRALEAAGVEVVPGLSAVAPPGGPIRDEVFARFADTITQRATGAAPDAVFLGFHGAMLTESEVDPEGALLTGLRQVLGPDVPIATALDLHAYPTRRMLESADICLACKENPHIDFDTAGARAARLLLRIVRDGLAPVTTATWIPLIIGAKMETAEGPLKELHDIRGRFEQQAGVLDISIYNTTAYLDAPDAGQCVTVISDGPNETAAAAAKDLAQRLWSARDHFASDRPSVAEALQADAAGCARDGPVIMGDQGDRVLAGTPGDDPGILREIAAAAPQSRILGIITDPDAVTAAQEIGVGNVGRFGIGALYSETAKPLERAWDVAAITDGCFVQRGPLLADEQADMGPTAVLRSGLITVVVTTRPGFSQDVNAFLHLGLKFEDFDVVVVKSGFHFRMSFADVGPCVVADTPGISNYGPGRFPYRNRRPVYPEDPIEAPVLSTHEFNSKTSRAGANVDH